MNPGSAQLHGDHRDAEGQPRIEETLAQELHDDLPSRRSDGLAHAHFDGATRGARGHHAHEVAGRDEQDQEPDDDQRIDGAPVGRRLHVRDTGWQEVEVGQGDQLQIEELPARTPPPIVSVTCRRANSGMSALQFPHIRAGTKPHVRVDVLRLGQLVVVRGGDRHRS